MVAHKQITHPCCTHRVRAYLFARVQVVKSALLVAGSKDKAGEGREADTEQNDDQHSDDDVNQVFCGSTWLAVVGLQVANAVDGAGAVQHAHHLTTHRWVQQVDDHEAGCSVAGPVGNLLADPCVQRDYQQHNRHRQGCSDHDH